MKWVKASERLPEVEKDDRPIMVDKRYYSAWYSKDKNYWITDYNEIYLSRQVEWLDESECDCQKEVEEQKAKQADCVKEIERLKMLIKEEFVGGMKTAGGYDEEESEKAWRQFKTENNL